MCLAVPGRVVSIEGDDPAFLAGCVDFCGVRKTVSFAFTPEVVPGDFVLVHVGFALTRVDREEAARTYAYLAQIGALRGEGLAPEEAPGEAPLDVGAAP
jgi:hydrogenase expression/formation protein HypC